MPNKAYVTNFLRISFYITMGKCRNCIKKTLGNLSIKYLPEINLVGQCKSLDVNCVSQNGTHGIIIFYILEPPAVQKYSICWIFLSFCHMLYLCICVFVNLYVYLCICICVFVAVQNIMFDVPGPLAFQKYNTCWVFPALHHRLYLCICDFFVYLCI